MSLESFVIASTRRVGSTALALMLDKIEDVECHGEMIFLGKHHPTVLPKHIAVDDKSDLAEILTPRNGYQKGIKFTIPEYQADEMEQIVKLFASHKIRLIHLTRSLLEQFVSLKIAKKSNVWHVSEEQIPSTAQWVGANESRANLQSVDANIEEISVFCERVIKVDKMLREVAKKTMYFHLDHAELSSDTALRSLTDFLQVKPLVTTETGLKITTNKHCNYLTHVAGANETFDYYEKLRSHAQR